MRRIEISKGVAAVSVAVMAAGALGGSFLFAAFTDTKAGPSSQVQAGTLSLGELDAAGQAAANYDVAVTDITSGDTAYRFVDVVNDGSVAIGRVDMAMTLDGALADRPAPTKTYKSALPAPQDVTGTGGSPVNVTLTGCYGEWTMVSGVPSCSGTSHKYFTAPGNDTRFTAPGQVIPVLALVDADAASGTVSQAAAALQPYGDALKDGLTPGSKLSMMLTYHLPAAAGNEYQGTSLQGTIGATAYQRAGKVVQ